MVRFRFWRRGWGRACFGGCEVDDVTNEISAAESNPGSQLRVELKLPESQQGSKVAGWPQRVDTSMPGHRAFDQQSCLEQSHAVQECSSHSLQPAASLDRDSDLTSSHSIMQGAGREWQPTQQPEQEDPAAGTSASHHQHPAAAPLPRPSSHSPRNHHATSTWKELSTLSRTVLGSGCEIQCAHSSDHAPWHRAASLPAPTPTDCSANARSQAHAAGHGWSDSGSRSDDYDVDGPTVTAPLHLLASPHSSNPSSCPLTPTRRGGGGGCAASFRSADSAIKEAQKAATAVAAALSHHAAAGHEPSPSQGRSSGPRHARMLSMGILPVAEFEPLSSQDMDVCVPKRMATCTGSIQSYGIYSDLVNSRRMSAGPGSSRMSLHAAAALHLPRPAAAAAAACMLAQRRGGAAAAAPLPHSRLHAQLPSASPAVKPPPGAADTRAHDGHAPAPRTHAPPPDRLPDSSATTAAEHQNSSAIVTHSGPLVRQTEPAPEKEKEKPLPGRSSASEPRPIKEPSHAQGSVAGFGSAAVLLREGPLGSHPLLLPQERSLGSCSLRLQERNRDMIQLGLQAEADRLALGGHRHSHGHGHGLGGGGGAGSHAGAAPASSRWLGPGSPCGSSPASTMFLGRFLEEGNEEMDEERDRREATLQHLHHLVSANSRGWGEPRPGQGPGQGGSGLARCILGHDLRAVDRVDRVPSSLLGPAVSQNHVAMFLKASPGALEPSGVSAPLPQRRNAVQARKAEQRASTDLPAAPTAGRRTHY